MPAVVDSEAIKAKPPVDIGLYLCFSVTTSDTSTRSYHNGKNQSVPVPVVQPSVQPVQIMASVPSDKSALTYLG